MAADKLDKPYEDYSYRPMLSILLAPAIAMSSTPSPYTGDPRALFRADDYPTEALQRGQQGSVISRLVVNPAGQVEACTVIYSSHSDALDRATCNILRSRARFHPARNDDDIPIYQVVMTPPITWSLNGPLDWRAKHDERPVWSGRRNCQ